ncbi:hypothetical protein ACIQAC_32040 [Streptomyces sp. NPDC088387]|uniref:hypothetical protein n=1 Tax=Streptomyces sp. NPDC088387 TaxID=3365859 RepID=UPI0037FF0DDD
MFTSGVGFFALFGFGWWLLGTGTVAGPAWTAVAVVAGLVITAGLLLFAHRRLPSGRGEPFPVERRRRFAQINALQWILIAAIAIGCGRAGVPELIAPLIALVVGVHFLPLAAVFEQPALRIPAALLIVAAAAGAVTWAAGGPAVSVRVVVGVMSALSLWGTGLWTVAAQSRTEEAAAGR